MIGAGRRQVHAVHRHAHPVVVEAMHDRTPRHAARRLDRHPGDAGQQAGRIAGRIAPCGQVGSDALTAHNDFGGAGLGAKTLRLRRHGREGGEDQNG